MQTSESLKNLLPAFAEMQAMFPVIPKTAENPFHKSKYADLVTVMEVIKPILSNKGFCFTQTNKPSGTDSIIVVTTLFHTNSGEWIQSEIECPLVKKDAQSVGSALTYCRRYALTAMLGLVSDIDDDGNHASQPKAVAQADPKSNGNTGTPQTKAQAFATQMVKSGIVDSGEVIQKFLPKGKSKFADLTDAEAEKAYTAMVNYKK